MKMTGVRSGVEITSMADIPSKGTGLGSSSSFLVGLLNALYAYKGEHKSAESLAQKACEIEINILKEPIGKQDQYIAAYGGLKYIKFNTDENVFIEPIICKNKFIHELHQNLLLLYTGVTRKANDILHEQKRNIRNKKAILSKMANLAEESAKSLTKGDLEKFGRLLHRNWMYKKSLAPSITNSIIDKYYNKALKAGAVGGKLLGAGGGGFLLLYCETKKQKGVLDALKHWKLTEFKFEPQGSKIIYVGD
jgi:D-glycero-alpha-D-manno-heptose-7-phosphate kinase